MQHAGQRLRAFTLIELLIVVAIIAILAAIAVPNFLEAQMRSKLSRTYGDMRSLRTALESYIIDYNRPPIDHIAEEFRSWAQLTSPVSYISSIPICVFPFRQGEGFDSASDPVNQPFGYAADSPYGSTWDSANPKQFGSIYAVYSCGPNRTWDSQSQHSNFWTSIGMGPEYCPNMIYNATNGTKSDGNIIMTNKGLFNE